jgi:hypothetical protein
MIHPGLLMQLIKIEKEITMTQGKGIVKGDTQLKLGSLGFITGFLLWLTGSLLLLGVVMKANNMQEELQAIGEQVVSAQAGELLFSLSSLAVMIGMAGVYRSIPSSGAAWARLGFYMIVVGTALWTIGYALDIAVAAAVANGLSAPAISKEAADGVVSALSAISRGTFPMTVVVNWLAYTFLSIGMIRSAIYPRWLGWLGLILGAAGIALGIFQTFNGRESTFNLFVDLFALTMLWFLMMGVWTARKAC